MTCWTIGLVPTGTGFGSTKIEIGRCPGFAFDHWFTVRKHVARSAQFETWSTRIEWNTGRPGWLKMSISRLRIPSVPSCTSSAGCA